MLPFGFLQLLLWFLRVLFSLFKIRDPLTGFAFNGDLLSLEDAAFPSQL